MEVHDAFDTSYLGPVFYRAPEVILSAGYEMNIDVWSAGAVLFEMFAGEYCFPGRTNEGVLMEMMKRFGPIPDTMRQRSRQKGRFFTDNNEFVVQPDGAVPTLIPLDQFRPMVSIKQVLQAAMEEPANPANQSEVQRQWIKVEQLSDLLEKCLVFEPAKRMPSTKSLAHPFMKK